MKNKFEENFKIDKDTPIIIYGAAAAGIRGYHSLKIINKYNVIGFFDKRADEILTQYGLPVWKINTKLNYKKEELLVVVCVKNVFEHEGIVNLLVENDYRNIIFFHRKKVKHEKVIDQDAINRNFQRIFNDLNPNAKYRLEEIPIIIDVISYFYRDYALIRRLKNEVVINYPLAQIFIEFNRSYILLHTKNSLCNVLTLVPHIELFSLFNGDNRSTSSYLEFCLAGAKNTERMYGRNKGNIATTDKWRENIIRNRRMVFDAMNRDFEINYNSFIDNAPNCMLKDNNFLVMKSAKHRAAFFIAKGRTYMPITMGKKEYDILLNMEVFEELKFHISKNQIAELKAPIHHPFLYNFPCKMWNYHALFVHKAIYRIAELFSCTNDISKITIEDFLPDNGAFSRCFSRIGFHVNRLCIDDEERALNKLLDRLFYITNTEYTNKLEGADIVCCSGDDIDRITLLESTQVLFILDEKNRELRIPGFKRKELLFRTIWSGNEIFGYMLLKG